MERDSRFIATEPSVRTSIRKAMRALALGVLLGGVLVSCGKWIGASLVCTALQSAVSAMVLAVLIPVRSQDLRLDILGLPIRPESGKDGPQENRNKCRWRMEAEFGLVAL
jgi:hypothetical protein